MMKQLYTDFHATKTKDGFWGSFQINTLAYVDIVSSPVNEHRSIIDNNENGAQGFCSSTLEWHLCISNSPI